MKYSQRREVVMGRLELRSILLDAASIERGENSDNRVDDVDVEFAGSMLVDEESGLIGSRVQVTAHFNDSSENLIARIVVAFIASYAPGESEDAASDDEWSIADIEVLGRESISHVAPHFREYLADATSKMGLTRYQLPLVRSKDLKATVAVEED